MAGDFIMKNQNLMKEKKGKIWEMLLAGGQLKFENIYKSYPTTCLDHLGGGSAGTTITTEDDNGPPPIYVKRSKLILNIINYYTYIFI